MSVRYENYTREDAVYFAISNDCWDKKTHLPIFSKRVSFEGTGTVDFAWRVPYNDLLQTKHLDTGGFMCDWFDYDPVEYGGFLCSDFLAKCDKNAWVITMKLATQPFMSIAPSSPVTLLVNDLDGHRGIGVTSPVDKQALTAGDEFTFTWDEKGYTTYAGNTEIGSPVPVQNVDIKLFYFSNCIPGTFMLCDENLIDLTDPSKGTPNDGSETLIVQECTTRGHKLSDARNSIYAIIQGRENTNVISRMDGAITIEEATTCDLVDVTFTFGESFLHTGTENSLSFAVHVVRTFWKDDDERFTSDQVVNGNYTW